MTQTVTATEQQAAPAQSGRTGPSPRLVKLLGYWCLAALAITAARIWFPQAGSFIGNLWWGTSALLISATLLDYLTGYRVTGLQGLRRLPGNLALGVRNTARLKLHNTGPRPLLLQISDSIPQQLGSTGLPRSAQLNPDQEINIEYDLVPRRRGSASFGRIEVLANSPWGLWQTRVWLGQEQTVKVYPNFLGISSLQSLSTEQSLRLMGLHQQQRRGEGMDFRQLREYRQGDSQRQVDWRASSRLRKLISREYQDERDQEIIYMLDCGRRMRAKDGELSHFDHALNGLLLSAYVAIKQGDAVGLQAFAAAQESSGGQLPPVKGESAINLLLNNVYDLHSGTSSADYTSAAQQLMAHHKRRALVILITNLRDEDSDELLAAVKLLSRNHLMMIASLRETSVDKLLQQPIQNFDSAVNSAAARNFLRRREQLLQHLQAHNVIVVDSRPELLHQSLVEAYWRLKRSGRI
ncbi:DUF58 domain-containing protein [Microbulbifer sp. TRSA001]|uniref:DUF58 domain-containing protein n=1 Tax=Microbulbifer sp. TRSA001 TaxID=3243381 RepID=UPI0040396E75